MSSCRENPKGVDIVTGGERFKGVYVKITYGKATKSSKPLVRRILVSVVSQKMVDDFDQAYPLAPAPSVPKGSCEAGRGDVITLTEGDKPEETVVSRWEENMFIAITCSTPVTIGGKGQPFSVCNQPNEILYGNDIFDFEPAERDAIARLFLEPSLHASPQVCEEP